MQLFRIIIVGASSFTWLLLLPDSAHSYYLSDDYFSLRTNRMTPTHQTAFGFRRYPHNQSYQNHQQCQLHRRFTTLVPNSTHRYIRNFKNANSLIFFHDMSSPRNDISNNDSYRNNIHNKSNLPRIFSSRRGNFVQVLAPVGALLFSFPCWGENLVAYSNGIMSDDVLFSNDNLGMVTNNVDMAELIQQATLQSSSLKCSSSSSQTLLSSPVLANAALFPSHVLSHVIPALFGAISHLFSSVTSLLVPLTSMLIQVSMHLQQFGETLFAAFLLLSLIQALVALYQYRYDVRGQLVFPDGLTLGLEDYYNDINSNAFRDSDSVSVDDSKDVLGDIGRFDWKYAQSKAEGEHAKTENLNEARIEEDQATTPTTITATSSGSLSSQLLKKVNKSLFVLLPFITRKVQVLLIKNTHLFHIGFIVTLVSLLEDFLAEEDKLDTKSIDQSDHTDKTVAKKGLDLNIRHLLFGDNSGTQDVTRPTGNQHMHHTSSGAGIPSLVEKLTNRNQEDPVRMLVIGDSLAIGIGCIEHFDDKKTQSTPMALIENTVSHIDETENKRTDTQSRKPNNLPSSSPSPPLQGPVFPQILARTLSYYFRRPVHWRSAGVDGGDVTDIRSFCMDVIRRECTINADTEKADVNSSKLQSSYSHGPPDIVICLFGMNDLKKLLSVNPLKQFFRKRSDEGGGGMAHEFRRGMESLLSDIHAYAPNAIVVFPALPIQTFHKNSIVNIVPLGIMVDTMVGFWEGQKKRVADKWNKRGMHTMYTDLTAKEIAGWYDSADASMSNESSNKQTSGGEHDENLLEKEDFFINNEYDDIKDSDMLLSADGVHPNKRMYAKWAQSVGHKIYERVGPELEPMVPMRTMLNGKAINRNLPMSQLSQNQLKKIQEQRSSVSY